MKVKGVFFVGPVFLSYLTMSSSLLSIATRKKFTNVKPEALLGRQHDSLQDFANAANFTPDKEKQYTLVMVTEPRRERILLGLKHRGFGQGMFNSFGGKIEQGESEDESARRELLEETGIDVPLHVVSNSKVGKLEFTFEDSPTAMIVHLFRINVDATQEKENSNSSLFKLDPNIIRGCDEITPQWFDNWYNIPLDRMFADDSVWLTHLLDTQEDLLLDGHFHFFRGGQETNQIMHYHVNVRPKVRGTFTLQKRLFHEIHNSRVRLDVKEFKESYAFVNAVRKMFDQNSIDFVVDVAGGHG